MQIPPEVLRCVAFLCPDDRADPDGTAFFVAITEDDPHPTGKVTGLYAVTAKHLLADYRSEGSESAWLRINTRSGSTRMVHTQIKDWRQHSHSDVAIHPWPLDDTDLDILAFPARTFLIDDIVRIFSIGPGSDVFITGLFSQHFGTHTNIPVVRIGNIAAMRGQPIETEKHGPLDAYLIEVRSLGGLSGSPVFVYVDEIHDIEESEVGSNLRRSRAFYLLGSIYGHYHRDIRQIDREERWLNSGIAIVVPAECILELLLVPEEIAVRERNNEEEKQRNAKMTPAVAKQKFITDDEFQDALRRVSRRHSCPASDQESKGT